MDRLVTIATFDLPAEAQMMKLLLEQQGFEVFLADDNLVRTNSPAVPRINARRSPRQAVPVPGSADRVDDVLRLQFSSPSQLFQGIHEREEQLRRRLFPPETYLLPVRR